MTGAATEMQHGIRPSAKSQVNMDERALAEQVMQMSLAGLLLVGAEGQVLSLNPEARRILGLSSETEVVPALNEPSWAPEWESGEGGIDVLLLLRQILAGERRLERARIALTRCSDGQRRVVMVSAGPLRLETGESLVLLSLLDVTEACLVDLELHRTVLKSEQESRSKSRFIANMAHEIRTPLNGVMGMAEVLERMITVPEQRRLLAMLRQSGEMLMTIVNDLLDMSKIEAGKLELESIPFRPADLAIRARDMFAVVAEKKRIDFEIFTSGHADRLRLGDSYRLMQILQNLVTNAIKFTEQGGAVVLTLACRPGDPLLLEVSDTGIGMSEVEISRMFRAFEQADGSVARRFGGTGLGMAIVRKLVELMDGRIEVESAPGRGTLIRVTLPLAEAGAP